MFTQKAADHMCLASTVTYLQNSDSYRP